MLTKTEANIVTDVRVCLDEIGLNDAEFDGGSDESDLDTIIKSKIEDALTFVFSNADYALLEPTRVLTGRATEQIGNTSMYRGSVVVGDKFLRLVSANMEGWIRSLSQQDLVLWNDPAYAMLSDEYCTGTAGRPKVALAYRTRTEVNNAVTTTYTDKTLELYSGANNGKFSVMLIDMPELIDTGLVDSKGQPIYKYSIPDKTYRACIYYIAGLTLTTMREASAANLLFTQANDLMGFSQMAQQSAAPQQSEQ